MCVWAKLLQSCPTEFQTWNWNTFDFCHKTKQKNMSPIYSSSVISKEEQISESQIIPSWDDGFLNAEFLLFNKEIILMNQYLQSDIWQEDNVS